MSKFTIGVALVLATALAFPADAAPKGGGGRGGGGGGGGGAAHGGGGGAHFSGGGGGARFGGGGGGGAHFSGGGPRFSAPRVSSAPHFSSAPRFNVSRSSGGPRFSGGSRFSGQSGVSRQALRSSSRGVTRSFSSNRSNRFVASRNNPNNFAGRKGRLNTGSIQTQTKNQTKMLASTQTQTRTRARTQAVHNALNSRAVAGALRNRSALLSPQNRARIVASAATAGRWQGRNGSGWWWRHRHGGFGWVGPLFWPFAYYDFYDYAWWGDPYDYAFWDYGYDDIYTGIFSPYGYDDYEGYAAYLPPPRRGGTRVATQGSATQGSATQGSGSPAASNPQNEPTQLTQMCGDDGGVIAGFPIDRFRQAIQPNAEQQAALDELARASAKAAQDIKNACPTQVGLTAPTRLALMEQRIEAMIAAVRTVQPSLEKLYGLLNDEQKARLNALGSEQREGQRQGRRGASLAQSCTAAQGSTQSWPTDELERTLRLTDVQRVSLADLQNASAKAAEMLKACPPDNAMTPPARLKVVETRLETMLQAVKTVRSALTEFYGQLTDEQKARFETLGPQRTRQITEESDEEQPRVRHVRSRRHHGMNIYGILRRFGI